MKKHTRKILLIFFSVITAGVFALVWFSNKNNVQKVQAQWFNDRWQYRQIIPITYNGTGPAAAQMQFIMDTTTIAAAGKVQPDCRDVRFADFAGKNIGYWVEYPATNPCNSTKTIFWLDMRTETKIPANIYIYYGNPSASAVNTYIGQPTGINLGTGADGACSTSIQVIINSASCAGRGTADGINTTVSTSISAGTNSFTVASVTGLAVGDEIIIIDIQGVPGNVSNVGLYETARINVINGSVITINHPLNNSYDGTTQKIIVQRIPNYTTVTLSGGSLVPNNWNGTSGGIVALRANGTVDVQTGSTIWASADGYGGGLAGSGGTSGGNGGTGGEGQDGSNSSGASGDAGTATCGSGRSGGNSTTTETPGCARNGGGGGGSDGSANSTGGGGGAGGGGGHAGGGGGGGGAGDFRTTGGTQNGGAGRSGGSVDVVAGGGGGACLDTSGGASTGNAGGAANNPGSGSTCGNGNGNGGSIGSGPIQGAGGGGANNTAASGAGAGGGGMIGESSLNKMLTFGGGGGGGAGDDNSVSGGNGASGGGIVLVSGSTVQIAGTGSIQSIGGTGQGASTGGGDGGSGAGGSVYISAKTATLGSNLAFANGGAATSVGTRNAGGGGGGDGRIAVYHGDSGTETTNPTAGTDSVLPYSGSASTEEIGTAPINYWKFDEGIGTISNNSVSSVSATLAASTATPTWKQQDLCIAGKCLFFDGSNDYASSTMNLDLSNTSTITVEFWLNWYAFANDDHEALEFSNNYTGRTTGFYVNPNDSVSGKFQVALKGDVGTSSLEFTRPTADEWHHYAFVLDKTAASGSEVVAYVDGKIPSGKARANTSNNTNAFGINTLYFMSRAGSSAFGKGMMDEVKIYQYARTADQIKSDSIRQAGIKGSGATLGSNKNNSSALDNGLVAFLNMDELSTWNATCVAGNINDVTGNSNRGALCPNGAGPTQVLSLSGRAASFNGTTQYVELADSNSLDVINLTISMWINPTALGGVLLQKASGAAGTNGYYLDTSGSKLRFCATGGCVSSIATLSTSTWTHVAVTFDGTNTLIYINGKLDKSSSGTITSVATNALVLRLGEDSTGANFYSGKIDEVRIYERPLSSSEIGAVYTYSFGPIAYWNFEDVAQSATVADISGNSLDGTWNGSNQIHWGQGKYGHGGFINNSNQDFVNITDNDIFTTSFFSLESWIKWDGVRLAGPSDWATVISKGSSSGGEFDILMHRASGGSDNNVNCYSSGSTLVTWTNTGIDTNWHHLACTYDGKTAKIYFDGALMAQTATAVTISNGTDPVRFGAQNSATAYYWGGSLDEVKIYNYPRNSGQIVEDLNAGHPAIGSPVSSSADWWKFDEGLGTYASSSGLQRTNAGLYNMDTSVSVGISGWQKGGKFNGAVAFDGTNDRIDLGDLSYTEGVSTMSATFWVRPNSVVATKCLLCKYNNAATQRAYAIETGTTNVSAVRVTIPTSLTEADGTTYGETPTGQLSVGNWTHVAVVYNGGQSTNASKLKIFINGIEQNLTFAGTIPISLNTTTSDAMLGAASDNGGRYFSGMMDEVKIFTGALTRDQVLLDMNGGQAVNFGSLSTDPSTGNTASNSASSIYCVPGDTSTCRAPIAEWNFDEGIGARAWDTSGNGNNGTLTNSPVWSQGYIGKSLKLSGTAYTDVTDANSLTPAAGRELSISAWVYLDAAQTNTAIVSKDSNATDGNREYILSLDGNQTPAINISTTGSDMPGVNGKTVVSLGKWHHIEATLLGGIMYVYLDGRLDNSGTWGGTNIVNSASDLGIGRRKYSVANAQFIGRIDQVRIYDYGRTSAQVAWEYNRGLPQTWWKFEECSGSAIRDSIGTVSGTINSGTLGDCSGSTGGWGLGKTGKNNYSLYFDGASSGIDYVSSSSYPFSLPVSSNASWGAWVKGYGAGTSTIMDKGNQFKLSISSSGLPTCNIFYSGLYHGTITPSSGIINNSNWHHLLCTYDGSSIKLYVDGTFVVSTADSNKIAVQSTGLFVGESAIPNLPTTGQIDDVKVWTYPLTYAQVKMEYNLGSAVRFGPSSGTP